MSVWMETAGWMSAAANAGGAAGEFLAQDDTTPTPGWDAPAQTPPGLDGLERDWIGWAKWFAIALGILGLIACGIMMMVGRRNRSHLAAEGASGLLWVLAGLSVVALAAGVVPQIIS